MRTHWEHRGNMLGTKEKLTRSRHLECMLKPTHWLHVFLVSKTVGHYFGPRLMQGRDWTRKKNKRQLPPPPSPKRKDQGPSWVHAEPSHWLHEIFISKTVRHYFWLRLMAGSGIWGLCLYVLFVTLRSPKPHRLLLCSWYHWKAFQWVEARQGRFGNLFRHVVQELLNTKQFFFSKISKMSKMFFLVFLESAQWVRFNGDEFINFRPKLWSDWILGYFCDWKFN
jgi:hypothetical protein